MILKKKKKVFRGAATLSIVPPSVTLKDMVGDTKAELDPTLTSSEPDADLVYMSGIVLQPVIAE